MSAEPAPAAAWGGGRPRALQGVRRPGHAELVAAFDAVTSGHDLPYAELVQTYAGVGQVELAMEYLREAAERGMVEPACGPGEGAVPGDLAARVVAAHGDSDVALDTAWQGLVLTWQQRYLRALVDIAEHAGVDAARPVAAALDRIAAAFDDSLDTPYSPDDFTEGDPLTGTKRTPANVLDADDVTHAVATFIAAERYDDAWRVACAAQVEVDVSTLEAATMNTHAIAAAAYWAGKADREAGHPGGRSLNRFADYMSRVRDTMLRDGTAARFGEYCDGLRARHAARTAVLRVIDDVQREMVTP